ncbi:MAG: exodeoxyribonuclease I, partial [Dokdonella sp.]
RYRARNWPASLNDEETARWQTFRQRRLTTETPLTTLTLDQYFALIEQKRCEVDPAKLPLLDALEDWGRELQRQIE